MDCQNIDDIAKLIARRDGVQLQTHIILLMIALSSFKKLLCAEIFKKQKIL